MRGASKWMVKEENNSIAVRADERKDRWEESLCCANCKLQYKEEKQDFSALCSNNCNSVLMSISFPCHVTMRIAIKLMNFYHERGEWWRYWWPERGRRHSIRQVDYSAYWRLLMVNNLKTKYKSLKETCQVDEWTMWWRCVVYRCPSTSWGPKTEDVPPYSKV